MEENCNVTTAYQKSYIIPVIIITIFFLKTSHNYATPPRQFFRLTSTALRASPMGLGKG
jgi:hypothetical protein